jgi:prevent-host-death family protein
MAQVNMLEAKTKLSKLVDAVETGKESEIILARNGKPVAKIVAVTPPRRRLGLHNGEYPDLSLEEFNAADDEIARMFYESPLFPVDEVSIGAPLHKAKLKRTK